MRTVPLLCIIGVGMLLVGFTMSSVAGPNALAEGPAAKGGTDAPRWVSLFNGRDLSGWVNVNTGKDTWKARDGLLVCSGKPIGVMRSAKQYENFILHIEWRHMKAGGNSGVFVWSEGHMPGGRRLPKGMEVQMLELDWVNLHRKKDGEPQYREYTQRICTRPGALKKYLGRIARIRVDYAFVLG